MTKDCVSEKNACDLIFFSFFFFFKYLLPGYFCCLAKYLGLCVFDSAQISKGDQMDLRTVSLLCLESPLEIDEKQPAHLCNCKVPEKQVTWYYKGSHTSDISAV